MCIFGAQGGKVLGYMVIEHRMEANLEKIQVTCEMQSPKALQEA